VLPDRRAVVFDLDDTLYPYRRFVVSGFAAAAVHLHRTCGVDQRVAIQTLIGASHGPNRGREVQACLDALDLPSELAPTLVTIVRSHRPALLLPHPARHLLVTLRGAGWRLGVLTNGPAAIQSRKVDALRLDRYVDEVVYATEHGSGAGKPEPEPFAEIARRLDVPAAHIVFVGDDEICDVAGAARAGMVPIRCAVWTTRRGATTSAAVVDQLCHVPLIARTLLEEAISRHAA
jgi:putative hydrolase of the HAD superfamily